MIELNAQSAHVIAQVAAFLSPLAVGYVTKRSWSPQLKAALNLLFATVATVLANVTIAAGQTWTAYATQILQAVVEAYVAHIVWSKLGVAAKVQEHGVADKAPDPPEGTDPGWGVGEAADPSRRPLGAVPRSDVDPNEGARVSITSGGVAFFDGTTDTGTIAARARTRKSAARKEPARKPPTKKAAPRGARKTTARKHAAKR